MKQLYEDGLQIKAGYQSHITSFTRSVMKKNLLRGEHILTTHTHTPLYSICPFLSLFPNRTGVHSIQ